MSSALDLLHGLVVNQAGDRWGDTATPWQKADAKAILEPAADSPRRHFLSRPKDGRKTADLAAINVAIGLEQMPAHAMSYALASDKDQNALLLESMRQIQDLTPGLAGAYAVNESGLVRFHPTKANLQTMPADAASIQGLRYYLMTADEVHEWKDTASVRRVWQNAVQGAEKTLPDGSRPRFVAITNAGSPTSLAGRARARALASKHWRVSDVVGPLPWISPRQLEALRGDCETDTEFRRLHMNEWLQADDALATLEDIESCCWLDGPVPPIPIYRYRYVIGVDLGLKRDLSAAAVCHAEPGELVDVGGRTVQVGRRIVVDKLMTWRAAKGEQVDLVEVEMWLDTHAREYGAHVALDEYQAATIAQGLLRRGVQAHTRAATVGTNHREVVQLMKLLKDQAIDLPDDPDLVAELCQTTVVEKQPNVFKLADQRVAGLGHHDRTSAISLAAYELLQGGARDFTPAPQVPVTDDGWQGGYSRGGGVGPETGARLLAWTRELAEAGDVSSLKTLASWGDEAALQTLATRARRRVEPAEVALSSHALVHRGLRRRIGQE